MDRPKKQLFFKYLRESLNHLHDPNHLRRSPLAEMFGVADQFNTPSAIRQILTEAIEALEPEADAPTESRGWRIYESVYYRYIQDFSPQEVADQLGISLRQLRREQRAALEAITYRLWEQFDLDARVDGTAEEQGASRTQRAKPAIREELSWLKKTPPGSTTDLQKALPATLDLLNPLAIQHDMQLELASVEQLPRVAADPIVLRQALLSLLEAVILQAPGRSKVRIAASYVNWEIGIQIQCDRFNPGLGAGSQEVEESLEMAQRLANLSGGRLVFLDNESDFNARFVLPAVEQLPVLVIDDNRATLRLLRRYATSTRYRVIGVRDPETVMDVVKEIRPQIIVLDVMMPNIDGWEVLGRLRQHPLTSDTPIVVCTILAQEALASSLGASAFVRKPVTRSTFLAALDRQIAPMD